MTVKTAPECVANSGANGEPEVPLWECPCSFCTKLDWDALDDDRPTLKAYRAEMWPEFYS